MINSHLNPHGNSHLIGTVIGGPGTIRDSVSMRTLSSSSSLYDVQVGLSCLAAQWVTGALGYLGNEKGI